MPLVIPCVDIQAGRAVRLFEGDPERETVYFDSPLEAARHWERLGAGALHLVDLDAATGRGQNRRDLFEIARKVGIPVEAGGGVRDAGAARALLAGGVARVVLGTAAVRTPQLVTELLGEHGPERIVVSVDARGMNVAVGGWAEAGNIQVPELLHRLSVQGLATLIFTDVSRDGTLRGLERDLMDAVRHLWRGELIVGGGVANEEDLNMLSELKIEGAIVGRALYEGTLPFPVPGD